MDAIEVENGAYDESKSAENFLVKDSVLIGFTFKYEERVDTTEAIDIDVDSSNKEVANEYVVHLEEDPLYIKFTPKEEQVEMHVDSSSTTDSSTSDSSTSDSSSDDEFQACKVSGISSEQIPENCNAVIIPDTTDDVEIIEVIQRNKDNSLFLFKCDTCHKLFKWEREVLEHVAAIHKSDEIVAPTEHSLRANSEAAHNECDTNYGLQLHNSMQENHYICDLCDSAFTDLSLHNCEQAVEQEYKCTVCCSTFYIQDDLRRHLESHTTHNLYLCEICNIMFTEEAFLRNHECKAIVPKLYVC